MRNLFGRYVLLLVLFATPLALRAQDNAAMTGVVTDTTGAVIQGTTVILTNASTGLTFTQVTDSKGAYRFPNVPPQPGYVVTFSHDGFSKYDVKDIELVVGITRTQDAKLDVGSASTTEEVTAKNNEVTVNTTDASIGNNFDPELINDLPIQARNTPAALFTLQPGVVNSSVTGARTDQTSITLDGMDINDISTGSFGTVVGALPVDAIQEFRETVAGLPSQLGTGGGGQIQLVSRNGTNKLHGNINEYHRDTSTTANLWFNNLSNTPRTPLIQNQFGGSVGGHVLRDKFFFFADFNDSRIIQSISTTRTVPLDSYRAGNIGYVNNGSVGGANCTSTSRQNTTPGCISFLSPAQVQALDPAGIGEDPNIFALINSRYPHANDLTLGDGVNSGIYRFTQPAPNIEYDGLARLDYNLTSKQRVFIQFHAAHRDSIQSQNRFGGDPVTRPFQDRSYGYVGSHIMQIGNNKVNQFYYGDTVQVASFPLTYNILGNDVFNTFGGLTQPYDGGNIQRRRIPIPTIRDDFNWTLGTHNLSAGGSFKFVKTSNLLVNDYNFYSIGLGGNLTGLNAALRPANILTTNNSTTTVSTAAQTTNTTQYDNLFALALGHIGAVTSNYNYTAAGTVLPQQTGGVRRYRYYQTEVYVGDNWKVSPKLTISYGLRYQYYSVPFESAGAESVPSIGFDAYLGARVAAAAAHTVGTAAIAPITYSLGGKANGATDFFKPNTLDFAPRFSAVYALNSKQVFNVAGGLVYDRTIVNAINFIQNQASYLFQNSATITNGVAGDPVTSLKNDPRYAGITATNFGFPVAPVAPAINKPFAPYVNAAGTYTGLIGGNSNNAVDPNLHDPYNISVNGGMQQEFPGKFVLKANYDLRLGRRLLGQADASQLINYVDPVSGQTLSQAFGAATTAIRSGVSGVNVPRQAWFENVLTPGFGVSKGYTSNTAYVAATQSTYINLGDITDALRAYSSAGALPPNTAIASQFATNTFYTNKGFSSYNGLLLTLSKNLSQGVQFDLNYTYSKSIDNVSVVANTVASGTGFICDALNSRACRGPSDFDNTHVINADFIAQFPVGRGRAYLNHMPWGLDEAIGGWSLSGVPRWQSGQAVTTATSAYLAGFANNDPAIFDGVYGDVGAHRFKNSAGQVQLFRNIPAAKAHFRGPIGIEYGSRNVLRLPSQFNMDMGLSKNFRLVPSERVKAVFRADFFNVLNHPTFTTLSNNITSSTFGTLSAQLNSPRVGQFSLRIEF